MREATTLISAEILREVLQFPEDVEIVGEVAGNVRLTLRSERLPEGHDEVVSVWIKKGRDAEPEFLRFEPARHPAQELKV